MLSYSQMSRITKEVVLGADPKAPDSREEAEFRAKLERQKADADRQGIELTLPTEWEGGFD